MAVPHTFSSGPIYASEVNENFSDLDGRVLSNDADIGELRAAPPAHESTHVSGGADAIMAAGTVNLTTGGSGGAETTFAHGLPGARFALASADGYFGGGGPLIYARADGTTVTVGIGGGPPNAGGVVIHWAVFR